jgi:hypothetical protein
VGSGAIFLASDGLASLWAMPEAESGSTQTERRPSAADQVKELRDDVRALVQELKHRGILPSVYPEPK